MQETKNKEKRSDSSVVYFHFPLKTARKTQKEAPIRKTKSDSNKKRVINDTKVKE